MSRGRISTSTCVCFMGLLIICRLRPWLLQDTPPAGTKERTYIGNFEGGQTAAYVFFVSQGDEFRMLPAGDWYNFKPKVESKYATIEEAEAAMKKSKAAREANFSRARSGGGVKTEDDEGPAIEDEAEDKAEGNSDAEDRLEQYGKAEKGDELDEKDKLEKEKLDAEKANNSPTDKKKKKKPGDSAPRRRREDDEEGAGEEVDFDEVEQKANLVSFVC
jgi:hypothetical protein